MCLNMRTIQYPRSSILERLFTYIANLGIMSTPSVYQLPLPILLIPDLHPMIRRSRHNAIAVEIELGHGHEVPMTSVEIGESRHSPQAATPTHRLVC